MTITGWTFWDRRLKSLGVLICAILTLGFLGLQSVRSIDLVPPRTGEAGLYARYTAAEYFQPHIPPAALVAAIGGAGVDESGAPVAYDDSALLYWLDRRGFDISKHDLSLDAVRRVQGRGGQFLIIEKKNPITPALERAYRLVTMQGDYILYSLNDKPLVHLVREGRKTP